MQKRIRRLTTLSVVVSAALVTGFGMAAPAQAAPSGSIKLNLTSSHSPAALDRELFAGKTSKRYSGERVTLQTKNKKHHWYNLQSGRIKSDGTFALSTRALGLGRTPYRAVIAATDKHYPVTSNSAYANIYNYFNVSKLLPSNIGGSNYYSNPTTIAGHLYPNSVFMPYVHAAGGANSVDVNISYKCKTFEATVGVDDSGYSGAAGTATVDMDGGSLGTTNITLGAGQPISYDITHGFRITLKASDNRTDEYDSDNIPVGWGNARILCFGKPSQPNS